MAREFQLLDPVTGQVLGSLRTVDDMLPGAACRRFFRLDAVRVESVEQARSVPDAAAAPAPRTRAAAKR